MRFQNGLLFINLLFAFGASAQGSANAVLDKTVVETGDTFVLRVMVTGARTEPGKMDFSAWRNLLPADNVLSRSGWSRSGGRWVSELSGAREDLRRLFGTGPADVWAAGGAEPPGRASALLHFDGQVWSRVGTGTGRLALFGLTGTDQADGGGRIFAAGASGGVLRLRGY